MIVGYVNADLDVIVRITVGGSAGRAIELDAVLDTGFNGDLTLPLTTIRGLGLPYLGESRAVLSSGAEEVIELYEATIDWDGAERPVQVDASANQALIGMGLLFGYELRIPVLPGATVVIQKLPFP